MYGSSKARVVVERQAAGASVLLADYGGVAAQPDHAHEFATISFVACGEVVERAHGRARRIGPGAVLLKPEGLLHSDAFEGERTRILALRMKAGQADRTRLRTTFVGYGVVRDPRVTANFVGLDRALTQGAPTRLVTRLLEAIAATLAPAAARREGPSWCDAVASAIESDPFLDTKTLAASRGMHPVALARAFRARFSTSPSAFARRVRLERAAKAITAGRAIAGAAADAGFADQAHLTRCFVAEFGLTPSVYRDTNAL